MRKKYADDSHSLHYAVKDDDVGSSTVLHAKTSASTSNSNY